MRIFNPLEPGSKGSGPHGDIQQQTQERRPERRWVLKSPFHGLWIDDLVAEFPDADLLCTHRPAQEVVPSFAKFMQQTFMMM